MFTSFRLASLGLVSSLIILSGSILRADVRMPAVFGEHMVLQQDIKIPVWGWAESGEEVTVTLGDKTAKTKAGADGKWRVDLDKVASTSTPLTMTVTGKNTLKFEDVLVGDVWVCSGQSNMRWTLNGSHNGQTEVPKANDPQMRIFWIPQLPSLQPLDDVKAKWVVCTPETAKDFSAVAYFFGSELRKTLNKPIGLIGTYWGGTSAQAWTSASAIEKNVDKDPGFQDMLDKRAALISRFDKANADYPKVLEAWQTESRTWQKEVGTTYNPLLKEWQSAVKKAREAGQPEPPKPQPPTPSPVKPEEPTGGPGTAGNLYHGMVAPIVPYAIKGTIWYQGESNAHNSKQYRVLFPLMISDWREKWGQGDFPFIFVQLASFMKVEPEPTQTCDGWPGLREAQTMTLKLPNTGMAVAIDIGEADNIHPGDKYDVGLRLAQSAKKVAYGMDVVHSGPTFDSMKVEGSKVRLSFKNTGSGLIFAAPPWKRNGKIEEPTELKGFAIAGEDKKFVWAKAQIEGNEVVVSSDKVTKPVAVRYGWANTSDCNLYNKEKLPAVPFRTDDWE